MKRSKGVVSSGFGIASKDPNSGHRQVIPAIERKFGLVVIPGTLNITLTVPFLIEPDDKWEKMLLKRCSINGLACIMARPEDQNHLGVIVSTIDGRKRIAANTLEIMSEVNIRDKFGFVDDMEVTVIIE
jgi:CTP-dependent riboflavin kinase